MPLVNGLVPSRFLTLTAHLVIVITIFWSRENNVRASLPLQCTQQEYETRDTEMVVALSVTLGLFAIELAGFFSGVSMFNNVQSLLSIGAHASASITLLFFLFEQLDGSLYWWVFAFCSAGFPDCSLPALAAHCSASICLSFFVFERWEMVTYWYILGFCRLGV
ncbi:transmembrane protein 107 isoform X3 [Hemicordylus capensis]|uniref:transmembrane protein 107 isoform X3 n=1 Tax=Hemicordylus capensis TaxID=884348 RepID=UPI0023020B23|nr:transmembrane protein 107 isoform X3 [Hemicordylus capensis]